MAVVLPPDKYGFQATHLATDYLIQTGHRKIAYIGCASIRLFEQSRLDGYLSSLREAGMMLTTRSVSTGAFSSAKGERSVAFLPLCYALCFNRSGAGTFTTQAENLFVEPRRLAVSSVSRKEAWSSGLEVELRLAVEEWKTGLTTLHQFRHCCCR